MLHTMSEGKDIKISEKKKCKKAEIPATQKFDNNISDYLSRMWAGETKGET